MQSLSIDLDLVCRLGGDWIGAAMVANVAAQMQAQGTQWVVLTQDQWDALCIPRHIRQRRMKALLEAGELLAEKVKAPGGGLRVSYSVPKAAASTQAPDPPPLPEPMELVAPAPKPKKPKAQAVDQGFEAFWSAYQKKVDRRRAERAYKAALKHAHPDTILKAATAWGAAYDDRTYQPHPTTWLNGHRWNDPPPARKPTPARRPVGQPASTVADLEDRASRYCAAATASPNQRPADTKPNG